jgi:hypothetical protein
MAVKQTGSYNPSIALGPIEESLTLAEYNMLSEFLSWCVINNQKFGHGNFNEKFAAWKVIK